jgi:excisionase family DNA binding protein
MRAPEDAIVGTAEMAAMLNISEVSVQRWARRGTIPALKTGRIYRFEVKRVVEALRKAARTDAEQASRSNAPLEPDLEAIAQPRRRRAS